MLSREWRCSWSSADRRCYNCILVINNFIAHYGAIYIRVLTAWFFHVGREQLLITTAINEDSARLVRYLTMQWLLSIPMYLKKYAYHIFIYFVNSSYTCLLIHDIHLYVFCYKYIKCKELNYCKTYTKYILIHWGRVTHICNTETYQHWFR